jgi:predicted esterase
LCLAADVPKPARRDGAMRLKAFEAAWEAHRDDPVARQRCLAPLERALASFFSVDLSDLCEGLDSARQALESAGPATLARRAADALAGDIIPRLQDSAAKQIRLRIRLTYAVAGAPPLRARACLMGPEGKAAPWSATVPIDAEVASLDVPAPADWTGDCRVRIEIQVGGETLRSWDEPVARATRLADRLAALRAKVQAIGTPASRVELASLRHQQSAIETSASGQPYEVDLPAEALLAESEAAAEYLGAGRSYWAGRAGSFHLSSADGVVFRLFVPATDAGRPRPLVIALHGVGGSENMFFEAYGQGRIQRLAQQHGWLVASPRSVFGFAAAPVFRTIEAVAALHAVDRHRIFVVGHSMGGMQAMAAVRQQPKTFAAVAVLSAGPVGDLVPLRDVPVFVATSSADFSRPQAVELHDRLRELGNPRARFRLYPDAEHLLVVRESLDDVLQFFDETARSIEP